MHDVSEFDANRLLTHLNSAAVDARKTKQPDGRWSIEVPEQDAVAALRILEERRLLRSSTAAPERAGITASREEHRFRFERGLSREIEHTLSSIEGVLEARVHLNLPQTDPLFGTPLKESPSSASVLLLAAPGSGVTRESIAALVSGASGIEAAKISVLISAPIDERSSMYPPLPAPPPVERWYAGELVPHVAGWLLVGAVALVVFTVRPKGKNRNRLRQSWNPEAA